MANWTPCDMHAASANVKLQAVLPAPAQWPLRSIKWASLFHVAHVTYMCSPVHIQARRLQQTAQPAFR